jgi:hypothetical protein
MTAIGEAAGCGMEEIASLREQLHRLRSNLTAAE